MSKELFAGKYQIEGTLGEGGMGIVYKGFDPLIARTVAIKTIRQSLLSGGVGQELLQRFKHEAQAAGRLSHPNIVAIYEYDEVNKGDEGAFPYFIMEYVEGQELQDYLKMGVRFTFDQSLHIIEQVLEALGYAHQNGIIHRDIKPANVILLENKTVKIADFGIAKLEDVEFTQTGQVLGTPSYMSPEQCQGLHVDKRSDLYSTGLLLYELLTGKKATAVNHHGNFAQMIKGFSPNKPDTSDPKTIHLFNTIIKKALAEDLEQRYQNAEDFLDELRKLRTQYASHRKSYPIWIFTGVITGGLFALGIVLFLEFYNKAESNEPLIQNTIIEQPITVLTERDVTKIENLLLVAKTHRLVGRLITPSGSNAYYSYKMILNIDARNQEALRGINEIEKEVVMKIKSYQNSGNYGAANQLATIGRNLYPGNGELQNWGQGVK